MSADTELRDRVVAVLAASREIDSVGLDVSTRGGQVTLRGEVGSSAERLAVRSLALSVPAVTALVDELHVTALPGEWRLTDVEIAADLAARLGRHPELADVSPTVGFHVARLDGHVANDRDRRAAHHLARTTLGVHFVIDRIECVGAARTVAMPVAP